MHKPLTAWEACCDNYILVVCRNADCPEGGFWDADSITGRCPHCHTELANLIVPTNRDEAKFL